MYLPVAINDLTFDIGMDLHFLPKASRQVRLAILTSGVPRLHGNVKAGKALMKLCGCK